MTKKDFEESLNAVFVAELDELLTPAEMTRLKKKVISRVFQDWDPFEEEDPLDVGSEENTEDSDVEEEEEDSYDYNNPSQDDEEG